MFAFLVGSGQKQGTNSFLQWQLLNPSSVSRLCTVKCISLPTFCPMSSHAHGRSKGGAWGPQAPLFLDPQSQGTEIIVCQNNFFKGGKGSSPFTLHGTFHFLSAPHLRMARIRTHNLLSAPIEK